MSFTKNKLKFSYIVRCYQQLFKNLNMQKKRGYMLLY